jgi:pSer/pThr/pTyr-binding forkhead associated (FHA) protein/membrane protease subunit (stomatin/prohibitin family)
MPTCPDCHSQVNDSAVFCDNCGFPLKPAANTPWVESGAGLVSPPPRSSIINPLIASPVVVSATPGTCSACGYANTPGEMFCQNCGVQLAPIASVPPPPPTPVSVSGAQSQASTPNAHPTGPNLCPSCSYLNPPGGTFCQNCGVDLTASLEPAPLTAHEPTPEQESSPPKLQKPVAGTTAKCAACGYTNLPGETFCQNCGVELVASVLPEISAPTPQASSSTSAVPVSQPPALAPAEACTACGSVPPVSAVFCPNCGLQLTQLPVSTPQPLPKNLPVVGTQPKEPSSPFPCPTCGSLNSPGEVYCQNCGMELVSSPQPTLPEPLPSTPEPQPTTPIVCPTCNYTNPPGESYCQNCGLLLKEPEGLSAPTLAEKTDPLQSQPATPEPETESPISAPQPQTSNPQPAAPGTKPLTPISETPVTSPRPPAILIGHLEVAETKASLPLPSDKTEFLIGRADPAGGIFPDIDLSQHGGETGGVSRQHARLTVNGAQILIEDLQSMNSTFINKQRLPPNQRLPLTDGDEIRLGRLVLIFYSS